MEIKIPHELTGNTFYREILPFIYQSIIEKDFDIVFDMSRTELANPEGVINLLNSCALIKTKYERIPFLIIPKNKNLISYLEMIGFFSMAQNPYNQVLRFHKIEIIFQEDLTKKYHIPKIKGLFNYIDPASIQKSIYQILNDLAKPALNYHVGELDYYDLLEESLSQLIKNIIEHNYIKNPVAASGYYMIQKMPYNKLEIAVADIGKGYRNRIIEMIEGEEEKEVRLKYSHLLSRLKDNSYLFKNNNNNPNLIAILAAINYRNGSEIPGLWFIKEFVVSKTGTISIHSGNITVTYYSSQNYKYNYHDNYYSGCHLKVEIPLS